MAVKRGPRTKSGRKRISKASAKLSKAQVDQVLRLLAEGKGPSDVRTMLAEDGVTVSRQAIVYYQTAPKHAAKIEEYRSEWRTGLADVPIANLRWRLEEFQRVYTVSMDEGDLRTAIDALWRVGKIMDGIEAPADDESIGKALKRLLKIPDEDALIAEHMPPAFVLDGRGD